MKTWTFVILGGKPFKLTLQNNPPLEHFGERTVWKLVGPESLAKEAESLIQRSGATVFCYTETDPRR